MTLAEKLLAKVTVGDAVRRLNPQIFANETIPPGLPDTEPQRNAGSQPLGAHKNEAPCRQRAIVRIERCGYRLLDKDNLYGGVKYLCDALRAAEIIPNDDPDSIELIVTQKKVSRKEIGTLVTITPL